MRKVHSVKDYEELKDNLSKLDMRKEQICSLTRAKRHDIEWSPYCQRIQANITSTTIEKKGLVNHGNSALCGE